MIHILNGLFGIIFSIFEAITDVAFDGVSSLVPPRRKQGYDADFEKPESMLSQNGNGFYIGKWSNSLLESNMHLIALGGSGSHKSTSIVFNTLLKSHDTSFIVLDVSKEIVRGTAPALSKVFGYKIDVFDCNNPHRSAGFNCISPNRCKTFADADKVANTLTRNSFEGSSYDFWAQSSENFISFCIKAIMSYAPPEYVSLYNVLHMVRVFSYNPEAIDAWLVKNNASSQLMTEYKGWVATPDRTLQSILSTAKNSLAIYGSPDIAKLTSFDTINFDDYRKEKRALFICSSPSDAFLHRSITATLFESFFSSVLSKPAYDKSLLNVMVLMDEAASMRINLSQALSLTRKHGISIATLWQDLNQIEHLYGKHESASIFANSGLKAFMPGGTPIETCRMIENLCGKWEYTTDSGATKIRELLTAQEARELQKILVLNKNMPPMLLDTHPYFLDNKLVKLTQLPEYEIENILPFIEPPLLQFE